MIVIQDFECFESKVLEDFIIICSQYVDRLPFVFVFGMATSIDIFQQMLPRSAISLLRTEKFKLEQPGSCIDTIIEKVLMRLIHVPFLIITWYVGFFRAGTWCKIGQQSISSIIGQFLQT